MNSSFVFVCTRMLACVLVIFWLFSFVGYRSVPLKNGYSEELELASLLVHVDTRNPMVCLSLHFIVTTMPA